MTRTQKIWSNSVSAISNYLDSKAQEEQEKNKKGLVEFAVFRLIDSVWTIGYIEEEPGFAKILMHDRSNPIGYHCEKSLLKGKFIETVERVAVELVLYSSDFNYERETQPLKKLKIINPKYVFNY